MGIYLKQLIIALSIAGISFDICADTPYRVPRLDFARIERRKEAVDTKFNRMTYIRYSVLAAAAAGATYCGYNKLTAVTEVPATGITKLFTQIAGLISQTKTLSDHDARLGLLEGKSYMAWFGNMVKTGVFGVTITDIATYVGTPVIGRMLAPLLDVDALWYQIRSEGDFVKGVMQTAKYISPFERRIRGLGPLTQEEKKYLCSMIEDTMLALNKQVEKVIAFVHHKQGQFKDKYPDISQKTDSQIRYLMVSYDHFTQKLETLLNDVTIADDNLSSRIIEIAQHFKDDYEQVKERLKDLEDDLEATMA